MVPDNFPIPFDGLLGNDFVKANQCEINYNTNTLLIGAHTIDLQHIVQPIQNSDVFNNNPKPKSELVLKPRSETMVQIKIINSDLNEGICEHIQLLEDVFVCPSIVKVTNGQIITSILNCSDKPVVISQLEIQLDPLPNPNDDNNHQAQINHITNTNTHSTRLQKITELLRIDHLNKEEKESLIEICHEYNNIFYLEGDKLSYTNAIMHEIPMTSCSPVNTKTYRYPEVHKEEVNKQINKMLEDEIIQPSTSPWNSPVWVVPKKPDASGKKKWRIVIDYRKVNELSIGDSFPLPNITDILDQLGHSKYFTTIDLTSGFHQIQMAPQDAEKTAFSTPMGHYQFNRMPFGLRNAPATFQRLMNTVLTGIQNIKCFVYLDDIVVFSDNLENHNKRLIEVFQRLSEYNLKIQPDKCEFLRKEVMYLGHLITDEGVKPDANKVKAVREFPVPKSPKDIKSFLGLAGYYRRFIPNFSNITKPLTKLLKKDICFAWTSLQQDAFEKLKDVLCSEPLLQYPDFSRTFYLTTDASQYAIGSVLSQGDPPNDLPVSYASRTLNRAESNYSATERELLAIVWSVKHFRPYLYGRKFTILTDNKPLIWLFNVKDPSSRLVRWRLLLEEYDYEIHYKPGKSNYVADALSRNPVQTSFEQDELQIHHINTQPTKPNPTYQDFLEKIKHSLITCDNLNETTKDITTTTNDIVTFLSTDLEYGGSKFLQTIDSKFNYVQLLKTEENTFNEIKLIKVNSKQIICVFYKEHYWEDCSYESIFHLILKLLEYLKTKGINKIALPEIGNNFDKFKSHKIRSILRFIFRSTKIEVNIYNRLISIPDPDQIPIILTENHSNPTSGHSGFHKTYNRVKQNYKWKNMKSDIKNFIKKCESCQKNKLVRKKNRAPMEITTTSSKPFEKIFIDVVGPLPLTENGNKFILTLQDDLTKFSRAYAIPNHETETIAKKLVENFICTFGIPITIVSDQGRDFTSNLLKNISKLLKIKHINCTAYHPQSNGALERSHATLADYLKHFINENQTDWDNWLEFSMFSYNTSVHTSTKFSPYELLFGHQATLPSSLTKPTEFKYTYDDYLSEITLKMQKSQELARENLIKSKEVNKRSYDKKINSQDFKVGDAVYLINEQTKLHRSKKLTSNYKGPYKIIEKNSPVNYTIKVKSKKQKVHANRLKLAFVTES